MAAKITPLIAGNWKMNGVTAALGEVQELARLLAESGEPGCTVCICPPATLLAALSQLGATNGILTGGQDCHAAASGPHTGDISAAMLADAGARYVIVGHSERRTDHAESDSLVQRKALAAIGAGLIPIICVGESAVERREGRAEEIVTGQLEGSVPGEVAGNDVVIAYEPVWAIGTGVTPTLEDIGQMHAMIRSRLTGQLGDAGERTPILYGGSLKPANAREILALPNVDGGLVGGASLLAKDFHAIISAL